ncbi:MAG: hypothetical protein L0Z62_08085 [Gemmataceae bacterium]|nr:hypothetical protein [Gemmataceae bacterium]
MQRTAVPIRDTREAAVLQVKSEISKETGAVPDVNKMIRCYWAWALLGEPLEQSGEEMAAHPDALPYRHLSHAWSQLVERVDGATAQETYILLPSLESECAAAFAECVKGRVSREAAEKRVGALLAESHKREREAAQAARVKAQEAAKAGDSAGAAQAQAESQTAEKEAQEAAKRQEKAEAKANGTKATESPESPESPATESPAAAEGKAPESPAQGSKPERATSADNLLPTADTADSATEKDWAEYVVSFIFQHKAPCSVIAHVVNAMLARKDDLDKTTALAMDSARSVYMNEDRRRDALRSKGNGQLAHVA